MTEVVEASVSELVPARSPASFVLREVQAAVGLVDLVAVSFNDDSLSSRICSGLEPITQPLRIQVLDALGARALRLETLARRLGRNPKALVRSTLGPLAELGAVEMESGKVAATGTWRSVAARLTAVELKLSKWRSAVRQADNASLSADAAWVVLDDVRAAGAVAAVAVFVEYGLGLATVDSAGELRVICRPRGRRTVRWLHAWMGELAWAETRESIELDAQSGRA
jgi:hypothetical protein